MNMYSRACYLRTNSKFNLTLSYHFQKSRCEVFEHFVDPHFHLQPSTFLSNYQWVLRRKIEPALWSWSGTWYFMGKITAHPRRMAHLFIVHLLSSYRIEYIINITTSDKMLTVELENAETSERWSAEFTSQSKLTNPLHTQQHLVLFTLLRRPSPHQILRR